MATVPTSGLEQELRSLYLLWVRGLPEHEGDIDAYLEQFRKDSTRLINKRGGQIARLGVSSGFPAPKELSLDTAIGNIIEDMKQAAITAGIAAGTNAREIGAAMFKAGMDGSYYELERLARTEVVQAYWENQWAEAKDLDLVMLWGAENGPRTCPWCISKEGLLVEDDTIRDHPNGRCTLIPTLPQEVPVRGKGRDPKFRKLDWDGKVPQQLDQAIGRGMPHAMVANLSSQQAIGGMVSQGWTSQEAGSFLLRQLKVSKADIGRSGWSQTMRALETYADEVWAGLQKGSAPKTLYRGGVPTINTGLTSWTPDKDVAGAYAIRNKGHIYQMKVPEDIYTLDLTEANPRQKEHLVLGTMRTVARKEPDYEGLRVIGGVLDGPTPYIQAP